MDKFQGLFSVVAQKKITPHLFRLSIDAPSIVKKSKAGQFVHIRAREGFEPFFRRPFSISRANKYLEIFYDVVGDGTRLLSQYVKGDVLDVLGPCGVPFSLPSKGIKTVVMVAGGIGLAPFFMLSDVLKKKNLKLIVLYGARNKEYVPSTKELKDNECHVHIATDDGSKGKKGFVSSLFKHIPLDPSTYIYTCGPRPMMASVQDFAKKYGLKGEASLEEVMACGVGTCLGCATKTTGGYKTVCHDGPVFSLDEVVF